MNFTQSQIERIARNSYNERYGPLSVAGLMPWSRMSSRFKREFRATVRVVLREAFKNG